MKTANHKRLLSTAQRIRAWKRGMEEMNRVVLEENRRETFAEKFEAVVDLMEYAQSFPQSRHRNVEEENVRSRWRRLHQVYLGRKRSS